MKTQNTFLRIYFAAHETSDILSHLPCPHSCCKGICLLYDHPLIRSLCSVEKANLKYHYNWKGKHCLGVSHSSFVFPFFLILLSLLLFGVFMSLLLYLFFFSSCLFPFMIPLASMILSSSPLNTLISSFSKVHHQISCLPSSSSDLLCSCLRTLLFPAFC